MLFPFSAIKCGTEYLLGIKVKSKSSCFSSFFFFLPFHNFTLLQSSLYLSLKIWVWLYCIFRVIFYSTFFFTPAKRIPIRWNFFYILFLLLHLLFFFWNTLSFTLYYARVIVFPLIFSFLSYFSPFLLFTYFHIFIYSFLLQLYPITLFIV